MVFCPKCFKRATERETQYGTRHSCCDLWSWDGGRLVDAETHELRQKAHELFDPIWTSGKTSRKAAYAALSRATRIPMKECHIKLMDKKRLTRVIELLQTEGALP